MHRRPAPPVSGGTIAPAVARRLNVGFSSRMAVTYAFVGEVLEVRASGAYHPGDVERAFRDALADPARPTLRALLYDVRDSAVIEQRRDAVAFFKGLGPHVGQRIALLVSTDVAFGIMRMVAAWADGAGIEAEVFRDARAALAWANR